MKQRLCIAQALLAPRDFLVLDEPMAHLDHLGRRKFKQQMQRVAESGAAILISSHVLPELQDVCDRVVILDQGEVLEMGSINEIREKYKASTSRWVIETNKPKELLTLLHDSLNIDSAEITSERSLCIDLDSTSNDKRTLLQILANNESIELYRFVDELPSLEDLVVKLIGDGGHE
jgi:ABC-2 type transport system ATP-binding protein